MADMTTLRRTRLLPACTSEDEQPLPTPTPITPSPSPSPTYEIVTIIDWVDFIGFGGISYLRASPPVTIDEAALGPQLPP